MKRRWTENRWMRIARYKLTKSVREGILGGGQMCKMCGIVTEIWEHVWEECGRWGIRVKWWRVL